MCAVVLLILITIASSSFGDLDLDFDSNTRNFSFELLYHTLRDSDRDVVISPYTIWTLLISMAYETLGLTWEEVSKVFLLPEERSEAVEGFMKLRNSVLVNEGVDIHFLNFLFYDEYLQVNSDSIRRLETDFRFITQRVYFSVPQHALETAANTLLSYRVPIRNSIRSEDFNDSAMIMCSYLKFIANWSIPFNVADTVQEYYREGDEVGKVKMMNMKARIPFSDFEMLHASVTELPYSGDGKYCLLLVRPHRGYDIKQLLSYLREVSLKDILDKLQGDSDKFGLREVDVKLPRFAINSYTILNRQLFKMGLSDVFDQNFAHFDSFGDDHLYIGEITHRVTFITSETQTLINTVTPAFEANTRKAKEIAVKDPFIYFIMEKSTATILFGGSYSKIDLY